MLSQGSEDFCEAEIQRTIRKRAPTSPQWCLFSILQEAASESASKFCHFVGAQGQKLEVRSHSTNNTLGLLVWVWVQFALYKALAPTSFIHTQLDTREKHTQIVQGRYEEVAQKRVMSPSHILWITAAEPVPPIPGWAQRLFRLQFGLHVRLCFDGAGLGDDLQATHLKSELSSDQQAALFPTKEAFEYIYIYIYT